MPKADLKVRAKDRGYYGFKIREEGEKFILSSPEEFSHAWMAPIGWTPPKKRAPGPAVPGEDDGDAIPEQFKGAKPVYADGDIEVSLEEAINQAIDDGDMSVDQWNKLSDAQRSKRTMLAVKTLIEKERARREDEDDVGEDDDFEEDEES